MLLSFRDQDLSKQSMSNQRMYKLYYSTNENMKGTGACNIILHDRWPTIYASAQQHDKCNRCSGIACRTTPCILIALVGTLGGMKHPGLLGVAEINTRYFCTALIVVHTRHFSLSTSVNFCQFLSISVKFCQVLSRSVKFCQVLSSSLQFCQVIQFLPISGQFLQFLSISIKFYQVLSSSLRSIVEVQVQQNGSIDNWHQRQQRNPEQTESYWLTAVGTIQALHPAR